MSEKIEADNTYETRSGNVVKHLTRFDTCSSHPWAGVIVFPSTAETTCVWTDYGEARGDKNNDLTYVSPYRDWEIDDKVLGLSETGEWTPGHFAGLTDTGVPTQFAAGRTSHSALGSGSPVQRVPFFTMKRV